MTITITPNEAAPTSPAGYQARSGTQTATGATIGAALDALSAELPEDASSATLVLVQKRKPDVFFSAAQQARLSFLMERLHAARNEGRALPETEQQELDKLVEAEGIAMEKRTQALLDAAGR